MTVRGSCFCGSVTYRVDGGLRDARSCHCSRCRKAFSAQASAFALVDPEAFAWLSGQGLLTRYQSSEGVGLMFCSRCGSTLCGTVDSRVIGITLGCVDGDPGVTIERHIFVESKAPWEVIPEGVVQYDTWPPASPPASEGDPG